MYACPNVPDPNYGPEKNASEDDNFSNGLRNNRAKFHASTKKRNVGLHIAV